MKASTKSIVRKKQAMDTVATSITQSPFPAIMTPNGITFTCRNTGRSVNTSSPASGLVIPGCQRALNTSAVENQV